MEVVGLVLHHSRSFALCFAGVVLRASRPFFAVGYYAGADVAHTEPIVAHRSSSRCASGASLHACLGLVIRAWDLGKERRCSVCQDVVDFLVCSAVQLFLSERTTPSACVRHGGGRSLEIGTYLFAIAPSAGLPVALKRHFSLVIASRGAMTNTCA